MKYFLGVEVKGGEVFGVFEVEKIANSNCGEASLIVDVFAKKNQIIKIGSIPIAIERDFEKSSLELSKAKLRLLLGEGENCHENEDCGTDLLILGMPSEMSFGDFFAFLSINAKNIEKMIFLKDMLKSFRLMVALRFHSNSLARKFLTEFNGIQFLEKRPEFCQIVPLEMHKHGQIDASKYVELPNCPLCIERLDASVTGIPSSKCDHESDVCMCFSKWTRNNNCKICNILLMGNNQQLACSECFSSKDSLWLCLVCGILGCGRYDQGHARKHYLQDNSHRFAIDTEFQRIWDYANDRYVHRVIHFVSQNRIVDFPGPSVPSEFSHEYYSECKEKEQSSLGQMNSLKEQCENAKQSIELAKAYTEIEALQLRCTKAESALEAKEEQIYAQCIKIDLLKKEMEIMRSQMAALQRELQGEKALSSALSSQVQNLQVKNQELQEQVNDLFTHFEMSSRITQETAQGDLELIPEKSSFSNKKSQGSARKKQTGLPQKKK